MTLASLSAGWRALVATWALLAIGIAGGVGWLAWLGPPERPARTLAAAAPGAAEAGVPAPDAPPGVLPPGTATPAPAAAAVAPSAASRGGEPAAATQAAPAAATPPALPLAPEPPALAATGLAAIEEARAVRPIAPPDPALLEPGPHGPLPRIGPQGRTSIRAYGRAFNRQDPRPRIGLVVGGLGLNAALTEEAIRRLPGTVGLAFSPYAPRVDLLLDQARARGMEVLVAMPLEPQHYPLDSPGNRALLTSLSEAENQDRLDWVLSRFAGYVGAVGAHGPLRGERYALLPDRFGALQQALAARGLLFVDARPGAPPLARAWGRAVDLVLDEPATRGEIGLKLEALERIARERGSAMGYAGDASPVLVERVAAWGGLLEGRGLALAPVSAMIRPPAESASPDAAAAAPRRN